MKLLDSKVVYEQIECIMCNGNGIRTINNLCNIPHLKGKKCPLCGGRGKLNKEVISQSKVNCNYCKGTGLDMENKFTNIPLEVLKELVNNHLIFHFVNSIKEYIDTDNLFITDCYGGKNSFAGCTDYIDHRKDTPEQLLYLVMKDSLSSWHCMQALNYFNDDNSIKKHIVYYGYNGGYRADWIDNPTLLTQLHKK